MFETILKVIITIFRIKVTMLKVMIISAAIIIATNFISESINGETPSPVTEQNKPVTQPVKKITTKDWLKDIIDNKEQRKLEIDKIAEVVDAGITVQMKRVADLSREIAELNATTKRTIGKKLEEINKIITGMDAVDFRLKTLYPDQLKVVESWEIFHKNLP